jgi:hypothetical protein
MPLRSLEAEVELDGARFLAFVESAAASAE